MKQLTLAAVGFERYAKTTRQAVFLAEMERVVPWSARAILSEAGQGPHAGRGRADAAYLFLAAMVQSVEVINRVTAISIFHDAPVVRVDLNRDCSTSGQVLALVATVVCSQYRCYRGQRDSGQMQARCPG
jgi:hypothetical protein